MDPHIPAGAKLAGSVPGAFNIKEACTPDSMVYYGNMPKGQRKYNGAQKVEIIKQLHNEKLREASSKYGIPRRTLQDWERIYLEEGEEALLVERRGRACAASGTQKGRKPKLDKQVEEDLIAENQRLRMEIDYVKKLNALVLEEERQNRKHK